MLSTEDYSITPLEMRRQTDDDPIEGELTDQEITLWGQLTTGLLITGYIALKVMGIDNPLSFCLAGR